MKKFAISLAAGASALFATAAFAAPLSNGMTTCLTATSSRSAWYATRTAVAGASGANAALLFVIHTVTPPANAISSAGVTTTVAALASARRE